MMKAQVDIKMKSFLVITTMTKIIGETPEVRSVKMKPREKKEEEKRKQEKKREKREKKRETRENKRKEER